MPSRIPPRASWGAQDTTFAVSALGKVDQSPGKCAVVVLLLHSGCLHPPPHWRCHGHLCGFFLIHGLVFFEHLLWSHTPARLWGFNVEQYLTLSVKVGTIISFLTGQLRCHLKNAFLTTASKLAHSHPPTFL